MRKLLFLLILPSCLWAQSNLRTKAQLFQVDTLQSNRPGLIYLQDSLAISGYLQVNNIEAKSGDMVAIRDTARTSLTMGIGSITGTIDSALTVFSGADYGGIHGRGAVLSGRVKIGTITMYDNGNNLEFSDGLYANGGSITTSGVFVGEGVGTSTLQGGLTVGATSGTLTAINDFDVLGTANILSLTASRLVASDASKNLVSTITLANFVSSVSDATGLTGTGKFVMDGTPTLVTPNIGAATGTSVNLTGAGTFGGLISNTSTGNFAARFALGQKGIGILYNVPGILFNLYYSGGGYKFDGTGGYGGVNYFDDSNGSFNWLSTTATGSADAAATLTSVLMTLSQSGSLYIADTIKAGPTGGGTPYSYFIPGGALVQSSTESIKKNIRNYTADLTKFSLVKPKRYNFKEEAFIRLFDESTLPDSLSEVEKGDIRQKFREDNLKEATEKSKREMVGFLAEEFNSILGKDSKEINQQDVINVMWLKIQELEARIKKLENK